MAIERRAIAVALVAFAFAGCQGLNKCKNSTLLVSITLDAKSAAADAIEVDVTVAGATRTTSLPHAAGSTSGTVEVRFPAGYPTGKSVTVAVSAHEGATIVGGGMMSLTLPAGCATVGVAVTGGNVVNVHDLAGADLTGGADIATGSGYDLYGLTPDMCPTHIEDCFNGVDDNCDGLADCADPQCTGGANPVAECVPDPQMQPVGVVAVSAADCGATYPISTPLDSGLVAGSCGNGTCACGSGFTATPVCSATYKSKGSAIMCDSVAGTVVFNATNNSNCVTFGAVSTTIYYGLDTALTACNAPSGGTATKVAPTWTTQQAFCSGARQGAGCNAGQICAPAAPNHCVLLTGAQVACSVTGYGVQNTTPYFTGFDDSARSCACGCQGNVTCTVNFSTSSCGSPTNVGPGCQKPAAAYTSAQVNAPGSPSCVVTPSATGSTSTTGFERTVCCMH